MTEKDVEQLKTVCECLEFEDAVCLCLFGAIPVVLEDTQFTILGVKDGRTYIKDYSSHWCFETLCDTLEKKKLALELSFDFIGFTDFGRIKAYNNMGFGETFEKHLHELGRANNMRHPFLFSREWNDEYLERVIAYQVFGAYSEKEYPEGFYGFLIDKPYFFKGCTLCDLPISKEEYAMYNDMLIDAWSDEDATHELVSQIRKVCRREYERLCTKDPSINHDRKAART